MKVLTVAIPCYNSQEYMKKAIESVLPGGDDVEIIVVDDGSKDNTKEIGAQYEKQYPGIVKLVSKENGGHGSAVNAGLANASGVYYKVLDSDDWFDKKSLLEVLKLLKRMIHEEIKLDMLIANYVYEKPSAGKRRIINYRSAMPVDELFTWSELKHFRISQNILMHSVIYRTQMLKDCGLKLPEHTFYVDNIFVYQPLPYVKLMYYMDVNLYRYFIGREDQSVNEKVLMKRIDQQISVTELVAKSVDLREVKKMYPKLAVYMMRNISIMLSISSIHLLLIKTEEAFQKRKRMWEQVKDYDRILYYRLRCSTLSGLTYLPGRLGGKITVGGYRMARKIYQFQ